MFSYLENAHLFTVCAFNPSCFLMNVSMSTSIQILSGLQIRALKRLDEAGIQARHTVAELLRLKPFNSNCTFRRDAELTNSNEASGSSKAPPEYSPWLSRR